VNKQTIALLVAAACTLAGCYDLNYADKQGVMHVYGSYSTKEECEHFAYAVHMTTNSQAWCSPDFFEREASAR
jgi:hypothetical protein